MYDGGAAGRISDLPQGAAVIETVHYVILGLVQGVTEFLPISSSGHLALMQHLLDFHPPGGGLTEIVLHGATLVATIVFLRKELIDLARGCFEPEGEARRKARRVVCLVVVAVAPTVVLAFLVRQVYVPLKESLFCLSLAYFATSGFLFASRVQRSERRGLAGMRWRDAAIIGLAQGIAAIPGISRTGATISVGVCLGVDRVSAAKFSFLISLPVIAAANVVEAISVTGSDLEIPWFQVLLGALAAAISGYLCLAILMRLVRSGAFVRFAAYTFAIAIVLFGVAVF